MRSRRSVPLSALLRTSLTIVAITLAVLPFHPSKAAGPKQVIEEPGEVDKPPSGDRDSFPLRFSIFREPIPGLSTHRQELPDGAQIPITIRSTLTLTIHPDKDDGHRVTYRWDGALPAVGDGSTWRAEFVARKPGLHTIRIFPIVNGFERLPLRIRVNVYPVRPEKIRVKMMDPPGAVTFVGHPFTRHAATDPSEFATLLEWSAPNHNVTSGLGPSFQTSRDLIGDKYPIVAGLPATPNPPSTSVMVYAARWLKKPADTDHFVAPTVRLHYEIATEPPGYEGHVHWDLDTMGTADVSTTSGQGAVFEPTVTPHHPGRLWRMVEADNLMIEGDPVAPALCTPCMGLCEQVPPQPTDIQRDYLPVPTLVGPPFPMTTCRPGTEVEAGLAGPDDVAACGPPDDYPLTEGLHPGAMASEASRVGLFNGEARVEMHFLTVAGKGFPFDFVGTYTSRADFSTPLGHNWLNNYNDRRVYVVPDGSGNVSVINGLGREDVYLSLEGGAFTSPAGIFDKLVRNVNNTYTQVNSAGVTFQYDVDGYLTSIADRAGNSMTFLRNSFHNISQATDSQGRTYTFSYSLNGGAQQLDSISDFSTSGRTVVFTHSGDDLTQVRSPIVTSFTGDDTAFPSGKTTVLAYTSGFADPKRNHNLMSIRDPHYASSGPAKVSFTYSSTTDPNAADYDHVLTVTRGNPPVGGTISLAYTRQLAGDPDAPPSLTYSRTTLTDANGNVKVFYFYVSRHLIRFIERTNRNIRPGEGDYITDLFPTSEGLLSFVTHPRGNSVVYSYDEGNPRRQRQGDLLEVRLAANGIGGGGTDLVQRLTHEPVNGRVHTDTDARAFPTGTVPLDANGHLNLADSLVSRYTITTLFDYQEGTGYQAAQGIPAVERIPEGLGDLNLDTVTNQTEGNVVKIQFPTIQAGPNAGQTITRLRTSNISGQPMSLTDPEGHVTAFEYYPSGDPSGRAGYLKTITRSNGVLNLKTQYDYDIRGNLKGRTEPKGLTTTPPPTSGQDTQYTFNELNQLVQRKSRQVSGSTRYQVNYRYSDNDDLTNVFITNLDENGTPYSHGVITRSYAYDILHYRTAETLDKTQNDGSVSGTVTRQEGRDGNSDLIAISEPLAVCTPSCVPGPVPNNNITFLRDERGQIFKIINGDNDTIPGNARVLPESPPADAVVVTRNYDPNGNLLETIDSIRNAQHTFAPTTSFPGSAAGDVIANQYDGFDRLVKTIDGEGNEHATTYDPGSNPVQSTLRGPVDHVATTLSLLMQTDNSFDEMNRVFQEDRRHFATRTGINIGDGHQITQTKYDRDGKVTEVTDDRNLKTTTQWDAADRHFKVIDALTNETEYGYDANSNIITTTQRDKSTDLATPQDTYVTTQDFDGIDRLIKTTDNAGDVNQYFYDSRGNRVKTLDAVRGSGQPTGPGNKVTMDYDALDRLVKTDRFLTTNGRGDGAAIPPPASPIETLQAWDDDSRLMSQTDHNGHTTSYVYDAQNRLTGINYADATSRTTHFDTDNQVTDWMDQNLTTVTMTYDGLDRLLGRTLGSHPVYVIGSTFETFGYDGDGRITHTVNDDGITGSMTCDLEYDSLSNRTKDQQGTLAVDSLFDNVSNRTQITYPGQFGGGRRVLTQAFDSLNRLQSICDVGTNSVCDAGETIATMHYKGPSRLERRTDGTDGTPVSKLDVAYDSLPRIIDMNHRTGANAIIAEFQYGFDRMNHRLFEKRVHDTNLGNVYSYDSIYRVNRNPENIDLTAVAAGTEIDPATYASAPNRFEYAYDGAGNRTTSTEVVSGASIVTTYTMTPDGTVRDAEVNQYTTTQEDALPVKNYTYDDNGNLTSDGTMKYAYDFKNRIVEVRNQGTNALVVQYSYDAFDRRSQKTVAGGPITKYLYDNLKIIEERDGTNAITRQYVWGNRLDNLLQEKTTSTTYSAHENSLGSIATLTNASGTVVERYQYDPFGKTTLPLDGATGNRIRFHSAYFDSETTFYFMRHRTYSPVLGRFLQRDPIGIWTDEIELGNGYGFVGNDAIDRTDPEGYLIIGNDPLEGGQIPLGHGIDLGVLGGRGDEFGTSAGGGLEIHFEVRNQFDRFGVDPCRCHELSVFDEQDQDEGVLTPPSLEDLQSELDELNKRLEKAKEKLKDARAKHDLIRTRWHADEVWRIKDAIARKKAQIAARILLARKRFLCGTPFLSGGLR
jgi:RHS repeat-associated protein